MKKALLTLLILFLPFSSMETAAEPEVSARSAIVIEWKSGTVLYEKNADEILPMASTTKLMTALVAAENASLTAEMKISPTAAAVDGSQIGLLEGQTFTFEELLYMTLLKSANDAATAIAENIFGSEEEFVEKMNEKGAALRCEHTNFKNVHGLPHSEHYTTARELAVIAAAALENHTLRRIVATERVFIKGLGMEIENSNKLLRDYEYACGMKTGFTKAAGRCLVSAAEKNGLTLIAVTLNAPNDWEDHRTLLDYGFSRAGLWTIVPSGDFSATIPTLNGTVEGKLINTQPLYCLSVDGEPVKFQVEERVPQVIFAPAEAGVTKGKLLLKINGRVFSSSPLAVRETVEEKYEELSLGQRILAFFEKIFFFRLTE